MHTTMQLCKKMKKQVIFIFTRKQCFNTKIPPYFITKKTAEKKPAGIGLDTSKINIMVPVSVTYLFDLNSFPAPLVFLQQ